MLAQGLPRSRLLRHREIVCHENFSAADVSAQLTRKDVANYDILCEWQNFEIQMTVERALHSRVSFGRLRDPGRWCYRAARRREVVCLAARDMKALTAARHRRRRRRVMDTRRRAPKAALQLAVR